MSDYNLEDLDVFDDTKGGSELMLFVVLRQAFENDGKVEFGWNDTIEVLFRLIRSKHLEAKYEIMVGIDHGPGLGGPPTWNLVMNVTPRV